jgi:hypothetical protein
VCIAPRSALDRPPWKFGYDPPNTIGGGRKEATLFPGDHGPPPWVRYINSTLRIYSLRHTMRGYENGAIDEMGDDGAPGASLNDRQFS